MTKARGYLIIGNNTFIGFTLGEVLAEAGRSVAHRYTPRQSKRCLPEEYFLNVVPSWTKKLNSVEELKKSIEEFFVYNLVKDWEIICCGEVESFLLHKLGLAHFWIADGSDLAENPFVFSERGMAIRKELQSSSLLKGIFTSQRDASYACRLLNLSHCLERTYYSPIRPDFLAIGKRKYRLLTSRYSDSSIARDQQITVASFSRRCYSGGVTFSKGTEHLVEALKILNNPSCNYLFTLSGPDAARFEREIREIGLQNPKLISHLSHASLVDMLANNNFIILDQFGEGETAYSGMLRESMITGHPIVSDNNFFNSQQLKKPVGLINAFGGQEISNAILHLQSLSYQQLVELSIDIIKQAIDLFSIEPWVSEFERKIETLNRRYTTTKV